MMNNKMENPIELMEITKKMIQRNNDILAAIENNKKIDPKRPNSVYYDMVNLYDELKVIIETK